MLLLGPTSSGDAVLTSPNLAQQVAGNVRNPADYAAMAAAAPGGPYAAYPTGANGEPLIPVQSASVDTSKATMDPQILNAIRERALAKGDSPWAQYLLEQQALDERAQMGSAARQSASGQSQALQQLAMRGGLQAGARERLAGISARDRLEQLQKVRQAGQANRIGVRAQDEEMKQKLMQLGLSGDEAAARQQLAISNLGLEQQKANMSYAASLYDAAMKKWAAEKLADAMKQDTGGNSGFLGMGTAGNILGIGGLMGSNAAAVGGAAPSIAGVASGPVGWGYLGGKALNFW